MNKIRKGDQVIVRAGNDKGKRGSVTAVNGDQVTVEGLNVKRKTKRPNPQAGEPGGFADHEMPIHASNLSLVISDEGKATRVGFRRLDDNRKVRFFKHNGEAVSGD